MKMNISLFFNPNNIYPYEVCVQLSNSIGLIHQEKALIKSCIPFQKFEEAENTSWDTEKQVAGKCINERMSQTN